VSGRKKCCDWERRQSWPSRHSRFSLFFCSGIGYFGVDAAVDDGYIQLSPDVDLFWVVFGGDSVFDTLVQVVDLFEFCVSDQNEDGIVILFPILVKFLNDTVDLGRDGEVGLEGDADGTAKGDVSKPGTVSLVRLDAPAGRGQWVFEFLSEMSNQVSAVVAFTFTGLIRNPFMDECTGIRKEMFRHLFHHREVSLIEKSLLTGDKGIVVVWRNGSERNRWGELEPEESKYQIRLSFLIQTTNVRFIFPFDRSGDRYNLLQKREHPDQLYLI